MSERKDRSDTGLTPPDYRRGCTASIVIFGCRKAGVNLLEVEIACQHELASMSLHPCEFASTRELASTGELASTRELVSGTGSL